MLGDESSGSRTFLIVSSEYSLPSAALSAGLRLSLSKRFFLSKDLCTLRTFSAHYLSNQYLRIRNAAIEFTLCKNLSLFLRNETISVDKFLQCFLKKRLAYSLSFVSDRLQVNIFQKRFLDSNNLIKNTCK